MLYALSEAHSLEKASGVERLYTHVPEQRADELENREENRLQDVS